MLRVFLEEDLSEFFYYKEGDGLVLPTKIIVNRRSYLRRFLLI